MPILQLYTLLIEEGSIVNNYNILTARYSGDDVTL